MGQGHGRAGAPSLALSPHKSSPLKKKSSRSLSVVPLSELHHYVLFNEEEILALRRWFDGLGPHHALGDGIRKADFIALFRLTPGRVADQLFDLFDIRGNHIITFRELIAVLSICSKGEQSEKIAFLFNLWDLDRSGYISKAEMLDMARFLSQLSHHLTLPKKDVANGLAEIGKRLRLISKRSDSEWMRLSAMSLSASETEPSSQPASLRASREALDAKEEEEIQALVDTMFAEADEKRDARISLQEFQHFARRTPQVLTFLELFDLHLARALHQAEEPGPPLSPLIRKERSLVRLSANTPLDFASLQLEDLKLEKQLGSGAFSTVYLVSVRGHPRHRFALKSIPKEKMVRDKLFLQVRKEREILLKLQHPLIVTLHATFHDLAHIYMLMEYLSPLDLRGVLRERGGKFAPHVAKFYAAELVLALEYLGSRGVVHRDLKPENCLLGPHGHLRLTDFGLSKFFDKRVVWLFTVCGTIDYMAPEMFTKEGYNMSVDWWALGCIVFEMLVGRSPFDDGSDNRQAMVERIVEGKLEWSDSMVTAAGSDLIKHLLVTNPKKRWTSSEPIKTHVWFEGIHWEQLLDGAVAPPIKPSASTEDEDYDDDSDAELQLEQPEVPESYAKLFLDF